MAVKIKSKGTILLTEISAVYTAIPNITSIDLSGHKSETFDGRTLDGTVHSEQPLNGYVSSPTINAEMFYDPDDTVHLNLLALIGTPLLRNFKITYTDTTPTSQIWPVTGVGFDIKVATNDGVKGTLSLQTSGDPT